MPGRARRPAAESGSQSAGPASSGAPGVEQERGNAFAQEQLAIEGGNVVQTGSGPTDPEAVRGPLRHNGVWDPSYILSNLTQIDTSFTETIYDGSRCGPSALLAVHIQAGPESVRAVARDVSTRLRGVRNFSSRALDQIRWLANNHPLDGNFDHLGALQEGLYVVANAPQDADAAHSGETGRGTSNQEMDRLDMLGRGGDWGGEDEQGTLDQLFNGDREMGMHGQRAALELPLPAGQQRGPGGLQEMVAALRRARNVAYILAVPVPGEDPNRIGHGITFGVDGNGQIYCYDPLPREGSQLMSWPGDRAAIEAYVATIWNVSDRVAGVDGAHIDPR